jgi:hypothetical protein
MNRLTAQIAPVEVAGSRYMDFETILRKAVERLDGGHYVRGLAYMHLVALSAYALPHPRRRPGRHDRGGVA